MPDFVIRRWDLQPYQGDQAPRHVHWSGDEAFCVVDGQLEVVLDDERRVLGAGDIAVVPAGTPHTFATHGDRVVRVIAVMSPQVDALVEALHAPLGGDATEIWPRYDSEIVGGPT
jgi:quercetin dioxygenase-like cupin family protein